MRTKSRNPFTTIRTEGGLLPSEFLQRVSQGDKDIAGLTPEAYHLPGNLKLNEAINRSWNVLLGAWEKFKTESGKIAPLDTGTRVTRETWLLPLFQELGYGRLQTAKAEEIEGKSYPVSHAWTHLPIHLVGFNVELDRRSAGVAGAARTSPHGLVQELLNRSDDHLWAFVSNGHRLRILRDNVALTRQAYVEFDLYAMMEGEVYSDFVVLWLVCHQSRIEAKSDYPATSGKPSSDHSPLAIHHSPSSCLLEKWMQEAAKLGTRALEHLRDGVEKAIEALGIGFVAHPDNRALKDNLRSGDLNKQDFYRQVLRIVYRLIFLFVAEDRELLHPPDAAAEAKHRYQRYYSLRRLRELAECKSGTKHGDLWQLVLLVFRHLGDDDGCPDLALPCLGSFLWSGAATEDLNVCQIANRDLLDAIRHIAVTVDGNVRRVVDYRNLGAEELGSIYESLLEMHPNVNVDAGTFDLNVAAGNERKTTGSYYTPSSLVNCLLDSALDPVVEDKLKNAAAAGAKHDELRRVQEQALLGMSVCDPACGSGHFLIAAAHRIAKRLAAVRTGDDEPSPEAVQTALRDVVGHCIYGIDINPMAVELCKVSLWMEAMTPGKPLSFLDHRIVCGNSLLGATPALIERGIPDDAFKPIEGDDKKLCSEFKKQNKQERAGQGDMFFDMVRETRTEYLDLADLSRGLNQIDDATPAGVRRKEQTYAGLVRSPEYRHRKLVADAWCAAFVWKKTKDFPYAITEQVLRRIESDSAKLDPWMREELDRLTRQYAFLHPHIAFPDIFQPLERIEPEDSKGWNGGFDVMLGNPPWDMQEVKDNEFFAGSYPEILSVKSAKDKATILDRIRESELSLWQSYEAYLRTTYGMRHFFMSSGRFPLSASGRVNLYRLFLELGHTATSRYGRTGMVVPSGFASDSFSQEHFRSIHEAGRLISVFDFENRQGLFPGVHRSYRFCLLTIGGQGECMATDFVFFASAPSELADKNRHITMSSEAVSVLNPLTHTAPLFRTRIDYALTVQMQKAGTIIGRTSGGWEIKPALMFMMNAAMKGHRTADELETLGYSLQGNRYIKGSEVWLPFYEGKMVGMYDHRAASIRFNPGNRVRRNQPVSFSEADHVDPASLALPMFWVSASDVKQRCDAVPRYCVTVKDVTSSTNERTSIAAMLPAVALTDSLPWLRNNHSAGINAALLSNLNALAFDFIARQKVAGLHLRGHYLSQLPLIDTPRLRDQCEWLTGHSPFSICDWLLPRVIELTYTAWDLETFSRDCGYDGPPFRWDEERRFEMRCELDAAFFHLYLPAEVNGEWRIANSADGCPHDETPEQLAELKNHFPTPRHAVDYIMDTFPIVKRKDEKQYGEYRTKRRIIEIYDEMAEVMKANSEWRVANGKADNDPALHTYQTHLDPPPGPPARADGSCIPVSEWNSFDAHLVSHIHAPSAADKADSVAKGKAVLNVLALLHSTRTGSLERADLEMGLILMRHDELRRRIASKGVRHGAHVDTENRPRITNMDAFVDEFAGTQFSIVDGDSTQSIEIGPDAESLSAIRARDVGRKALARAHEALAAIERIRNEGLSSSEALDVLGGKHVAAFAIQ